MLDAATNRVQFNYAGGLEDAFPSIDPQHRPNGQFVILQLRRAKAVTAGGVILVGDSKDVENSNTQVAKVVAIGPGAFKRRDDGTPWPEGDWFKVGDFVRCPKFGGDRWAIDCVEKIAERKIGNVIIPASEENSPVVFVMMKELDCRCVVTGDPLSVKAYL